MRTGKTQHFQVFSHWLSKNRKESEPQSNWKIPQRYKGSRF